MEYKSLLIDTSFLISALLPQDVNNEKAKKLLESIINIPHVYITNYIFTELATVLSQKLGKSEYRNFVTKQKELNITEIYINERLNNKIKEEFFNESQKDVSFVDISSAVIVQEYNIEAVATFDIHFEQLSKRYGFKVLK